MWFNTGNVLFQCFSRSWSQIDISQSKPCHLALNLIFESYKRQDDNGNFALIWIWEGLRCCGELSAICNLWWVQMGEITITYRGTNSPSSLKTWLPCAKMLAVICGKDFPPPVAMLRTTCWPSKMSWIESSCKFKLMFHVQFQSFPDAVAMMQEMAIPQLWGSSVLRWYFPAQTFL